MANALYVAYRNGVLGAHATLVDLDTDTINVALIDHAGDTPIVATDDFYDDINTGLIDTVETLATKTIGSVAAGVFDADNVTFTAVSGASVESVNIFKDTGTPATSNLIAYFDTGTGLPVTPNGGDITVTWNASGIFTF
jgi:hypothetical protein